VHLEATSGIDCPGLPQAYANRGTGFPGGLARRAHSVNFERLLEELHDF
jgi:hypothetical protein